MLVRRVNQVTQEWSDGIVPFLVRICVTDESDNFNWVVFDGPVDALWIENMVRLDLLPSASSPPCTASPVAPASSAGTRVSTGR